MLQDVKYRIYPSLLNQYQRLLEAEKEFESFYNEDGEGGYKRTLDEIRADLEQDLLDSINRVPCPPIEAADKGTAFNEVVDCLIHNRPSTNDEILIKSDKAAGIIHTEIDGFTFDFDLAFCQQVANYFKGSQSQIFCQCTLPTKFGDVQLYGFLDELRENIVYDIKTCGSYSFGNYSDGWQKHLYPVCLIRSGMVTEVSEFEYTACQLSGGTSRTPVISGTMYRERYDFDYEHSLALLTDMCEQFIEWLEAHKDRIYKRKVFNEDDVQAHYLFFDTETTGLPKNYNAPATDTDNWPRLVQLGWYVTSKEGVIIKRGNRIIKPDGFVIPEQASAVHGITTDIALEQGQDLRQVLDEFQADLEQVQAVVGHNIPFDVAVVACEMVRLGMSYGRLVTMTMYDTMRETIKYCKLPNKTNTGYKFPKLQELYVKLFGHEFEDAHDAFSDISATKDCFYELVNRQINKAY